MSKRDLKKYIKELTKQQLEEQIISLYDKIGEVKTYYDFVFNPKEDKLEQEAKLKIKNEYFPIRGKRPKLRRSTAQKYIKHFIFLGVDSYLVADIMLYNIETAQKYTAKKEVYSSSFYKSMFNSFEQAVNFIIINGIISDFKPRIFSINDLVSEQKWENRENFESIIENFD